MGAWEFFADVRRASMKVEDCQRIISALKGGPIATSSSDGPHGKGDHSDPTATAFLRTVETMAAAIRQRDICTEIIGEALQIIDSLRHVPSVADKADVLELYYVDCQTWDEVGEHYGIAESTARMWRDDLLAFIDAHPLAYIMSVRYAELPIDSVNC